MVRVGFIVEGSSEKIIVESPAFGDFLSSLGYELVTPVIDANGGGNLLPKNIGAFVTTLKAKNIDKICVLTDLENDPSVQTVRDRIAHPDVDFAFIAVKALEAWFLADTEAIRAWIQAPDFYEDNPESTVDKPWERLKEIARERGKPGPGSKVTFANRITKRHGFKIEEAAAHQRCVSAKDLVDYFKRSLDLTNC